MITPLSSSSRGEKGGCGGGKRNIGWAKIKVAKKEVNEEKELRGN